MSRAASKPAAVDTNAARDDARRHALAVLARADVDRASSRVVAIERALAVLTDPRVNKPSAWDGYQPGALIMRAELDKARAELSAAVERASR